MRAGYPVAELEVVVLLLREVDDQVVVAVVLVEEAGHLRELVAVGRRDEAFRRVGHRDDPRRDVGQVQVVVLVLVAGLLPGHHLPQHRLHFFALDIAGSQLINTFFRGQLSLEWLGGFRCAQPRPALAADRGSLPWSDLSRTRRPESSRYGTGHTPPLTGDPTKHLSKK